MANLITIGISKIEFGDIAGDGGIASTFAAVGYTAEGSANLETDDPTVTDFFAEEIETPIHTEVKMGKTRFNFQLASPDLTQIATIMGLTVSGTGDAAVVNYPSSTVRVEKSVKITPAVGLVIKIPRGLVHAKFNGPIGRADTLKLDVTVEVMQPKKAGTPPMILSLLAGEA